tara:strand:- start:193 stop:1152 length:960 start_codon:yes stop_codon:yes gene_type:complete
MKKVLVTGGTGFLGSSLVKGLVHKGYHVRVLDNNFRGSLDKLSSIINDIEIIEGDIRDPDIVLDASKNIEWIFHLAFINGTKFFYEKPQLVLDVGTRGALNTMDAAMKIGAEKYILASSSEVYQQPKSYPTDETERIIIPDVLNPRFSYSGGKIISELLGLHYLRDIQKIIFRPHNVYGPNMGWEHVIPEFIKKIRLGNKIGNELDFQIQGSGDETRAFCYVDDAVDGIILCSEKGKDSNIYHIGVNEEIKISQLAAMIGKLAGTKLNIIKDKIREGGTPRRCPDISKITKLGFKPSTQLNDGLKKCWSWYSKADIPSN